MKTKSILNVESRNLYYYFSQTVSCMVAVVVLAVIYILEKIYRFMNGRAFGYRLVHPYAEIWQAITWGSLIIGIHVYLIFPALDWWCNYVIRGLNYVIWG